MKGIERPAAAALLALLTCACSTAPQDLSSFRLHSANSIVESDGADEVLVAVYRDGQIHGADAFETLPSGFQSMLDSRDPIDHPHLDLWRAQLARIRGLIVEPDASVWEIGWVGTALPFQAALDDALLLYVGGNPARAALALDLGEGLEIGRAARFLLLDTALLDPDLDDARAAEWMRTFIDRDNTPAVRELAQSTTFGPRAAMAGLAELHRFAPRDRLALYTLFAGPLAGQPQRGDLLFDSLAVLPREQRGATAARLLATGSPRLHLLVAERLAELPDHERLDLLTAVVQGPYFVGEIQTACVLAAQALPEPWSAIAIAEIGASGRLEPATRELLIR